jgi:PhnB protein
MAVRPIPEGYHSVTPYLIVKGAAAAIDFYKKAFGATELFRFPMPDGQIAHAEMRIGDSPIMLADEPHDEAQRQMGYRSPKSIGGTPVSIMLYVEDVDAVAKQAVMAGAKEIQPVVDKFYGDRSGTFLDPFGHIWTIGTHKEDVSVQEMQRRASQHAH